MLESEVQRRANSNEEDEDDHFHASGSESSDEYSDKPQNSTPRSSGGRRDQRPQSQHAQPAPDAPVGFFAQSSGFEINGGNFTSIGGTAFNTASPYADPTTTPRRPSSPRMKTEFFRNASHFKIDGGEFTAVNGDMHPLIHINVGPSPAGEYVESETISCWIAAERALHHAQAKHLSVAEVFNACGIAEIEYHVQAGFDEELIKSGTAYLEQIHVFVAVEVDASSPILSELGAIFSPFSSVLFTGSSTYRLPVHKEDGSIWEFSEMVFFTAVKFADGGRTAKTPLTAISYCSQTHNLDSGATGISSSSGNEEDDPMEGITTPSKGKRREGGEDNQEDGEDMDDDDPPDDPDDPSEGGSGSIPGPASITFDIASDIYETNDPLDSVLQSLNVHGTLIIETTPLSLSPPQFSERRVHFTELNFDTEPRTDIAYRQFYVRVAIDSHQENAFVVDVQPRKTPYYDGEEILASNSKTGPSRGVTAGLTLGLHPQGSVSGTMTKTSEENTGTELKRYRSSISEHHNDGSVRWGFNVEDPNFQKWGIDMPPSALPNVRFEFAGDSEVPRPPPKHVDTVISSYWSMIPSGETRGKRIPKLLRMFKSSGRDHEARPSYTNLFNVVVLRTTHDEPSKHPESSRYKAKVDVRSGISEDPRVQRQAAKSAKITSLTGDDLEKLHNFNIPTIAKLELSPHCFPTLETSPAIVKAIKK